MGAPSAAGTNVSSISAERFISAYSNQFCLYAERLNIDVVVVELPDWPVTP